MMVQAATTEDMKQGDIVCFGNADDSIGFTAQWQVLDASHTNTGETGMFLISKDLIGTDAKTGMLYKDIGDDIVVSFNDKGKSYATQHPDVLDYQASDIKTWCTEFATSHFSKSEQLAMIKTTKSDDAYCVPVLLGSRSTTVDFDPAENVLNGDQLFLLSAEEANNPDYGFTNADTRTASLNGTDGMWWLRSPHSPTFPLDVGMVFVNGSIMDFPVNAQTGFSADFLTCARPAFNLDTTQIRKIEATGTTEDGATIWTLSLAHDGSAYIFWIIGVSCVVIGGIILLIVRYLHKKK